MTPDSGHHRTPKEHAREMGHKDVADLLEQFENDPVRVTDQLCKEFGLAEPHAEAFALTVMLSDGHLRLMNQ